jgi:hypothetical protein
VSDPYRAAPSEPCLRCRAPMALDPETHDPVCGAGCGSWISAGALDALLPPDVIELAARDNPFRVEAFGVVHCPRCKTTLRDCYAGKPVVSFARCATHGVWIDGETRSELLAACAALIEEATEIRAEVDKLKDIDPRELARRVVKLERTLADHARRLDDLEQRLTH